MLFKLVIASLWSRKAMALLTCTSIAISMLVLIGVEQLRTQVKENFERTVSGVDLIVGSRTSSINLLLFSIFKIGNASNNLQWQTYQTFAEHSYVDWSVPLSMGDSHEGFSVIGTTTDYFEYFKYANKTSLSFSQGQPFSRLYQVVVGAELAKKLGYSTGDKLVLSHGTAKVSFSHHDDHPFTVVGVLQATGTPVDQSLYIPLQSVDILHSHQEIHDELLTTLPLGQNSSPQLSAFLLGSNNKLGLLKLQRDINQYSSEPLSAILPLVALRELWQVVSAVEVSLKLISWLILVTALICMMTMLLASMKERSRELAVLRALGAKAYVIITMVVLEAILLTVVGAAIGYLFASIGLLVSKPLLEETFSLYINAYIDLNLVAPFILMAIGLSILLSFIPALIAYKKSLNDGLKN
jgi:putative ABC transport system permease protein